MRGALRAVWGLLAVAGAAGCAASAPVVEWGRTCEAEMDPVRRLRLVRKIISTGDPRSIPVLIDCLEAFKRYAKKPDRVYESGTIEPNVTAPPEFWGLYILTRQDFDLDVEKWRDWYELNESRLVWDGGRRRFLLK